MHRRDEPVSAFRQGLDILRILRGVAERLADLINRRAQAVVEVDDRFRAPDLLLQFLPGDDFSGVAEQDGEQLERLALQLDADAALPQFTGPQVGFEHAKPDFSRIASGSVRAWNVQQRITTDHGPGHPATAGRQSRGPRLLSQL